MRAGHTALTRRGRWPSRTALRGWCVCVCECGRGADAGPARGGIAPSLPPLLPSRVCCEGCACGTESWRRHGHTHALPLSLAAFHGAGLVGASALRARELWRAQAYLCKIETRPVRRVFRSNRDLWDTTAAKWASLRARNRNLAPSVVVCARGVTFPLGPVCSGCCEGRPSRRRPTTAFGCGAASLPAARCRRAAPLPPEHLPYSLRASLS